MRGALARSLVTVTLVLGAAGCATPAGGDVDPSPPLTLGRRRLVVGGAELGGFRAANAYEAIRLARSRFGLPAEAFELRQGVRVYVDGLPVFHAGELRRMPASWIADVEYLPPEPATRWLGAGHPEGAILVSTWARRRR